MELHVIGFVYPWRTQLTISTLVMLGSAKISINPLQHLSFGWHKNLDAELEHLGWGGGVLSKACHPLSQANCSQVIENVNAGKFGILAGQSSYSHIHYLIPTISDCIPSNLRTCKFASLLSTAAS